ncbi:MAG TPA: hypothetical protein VLC09_19240 [Polyangiaceae bacterium]|nr:hypothetical protein [Polyangiaceae bacterium]
MLRRARSLVLAGLVTLNGVACGGSQATAPAADTPSAKKSEAPPGRPSGQPFGGEGYGFVEATSKNGRFEAVRRFAGTTPPSFGHHGEAGVEATLEIFDLVANSSRPYEEIIDVEPSRRFFLLLEGKAPLLLDTKDGTRSLLPSADPEGDDNACLPPRQAAFSASGRRIAWLTGGAHEVRVRDLGDGSEWPLTSAERIWRAWPDDDRKGAVLGEVPAGEDWPMQQTSCACRWCGRFAASYGFYG